MFVLSKNFREVDGNVEVRSRAFVQAFDVNVEKDLYSFLTCKKWLQSIDLIEFVSRSSLEDCDSLEWNLNIADLIELMLGDRNKHFFASSLRMMIMKNYMDSRPNEFDIHELFKSNYKKVIDDRYELTKRKNNPKHIPDFWLSDGHEYVPVEIKLNHFNKNHLRQLERYMNHYGCSKGIAVAKGLDCVIPENIMFVNYKNIEFDAS